VPAGMVSLIPATVELLITYQEGLAAVERPEAVMEPVAIVRISMLSSQAVAVCPKMKSIAPTMRLFAYSWLPVLERSVSW